MTDRIVLVHVGFPKTASTWLRNRVLANESLGFTCPFGARTAQAIETFVLHPLFHFDVQAARETFLPALTKAWQNNKVPVISEETLLGDIVVGKYWGERVMGNMRRTFARGQLKILFTIREQKQLIFSAYKEYVRGGGYMSIDSYLWSGKRRIGYRGPLHLDALQYDVIYENLVREFGPENVLTLTQEELSGDPKSAVAKLQSWLGMENTELTSTMKMNVGMRGFTLYVKSKLNRYIPTSDLMHEHVPLSRRILDKLCRISEFSAPNWLHNRYERMYRREIEMAVGCYFEESNKRLAARVASVRNFVYGYSKLQDHPRSTDSSPAAAPDGQPAQSVGKLG